MAKVTLDEIRHDLKALILKAMDTADAEEQELLELLRHDPVKHRDLIETIMESQAKSHGPGIKARQVLNSEKDIRLEFLCNMLSICVEKYAKMYGMRVEAQEEADDAKKET